MVPSTVCTGPTAHGQTARNSCWHTLKEWGPKMQKNGSLPRQGPAGRDLPPKPEVSLQNHFAALRLERPIITEKTLKPNKAVLGVKERTLEHE